MGQRATLLLYNLKRKASPSFCVNRTSCEVMQDCRIAHQPFKSRTLFAQVLSHAVFISCTLSGTGSRPNALSPTTSNSFTLLRSSRTASALKVQDEFLA